MTYFSGHMHFNRALNNPWFQNRHMRVSDIFLSLFKKEKGKIIVTNKLLLSAVTSAVKRRNEKP